MIGDHFAQLHVEDMLMDYLILHIVLNIIAMVAARSGHVALIGIDVALCAIQEIVVVAATAAVAAMVVAATAVVVGQLVVMAELVTTHPIATLTVLNSPG